MLRDRLDIEPHDSEQLQEIEMLADLILACSTSPTRLSALDVDITLGLPDPTREDVA